MTRSIKQLSTLLLLLLVDLVVVDATNANHKTLFPNSDEYDSKILDPTTIYGSPYGGFSRATRSRLAALPLRLPDVAILEDDDDDVDKEGNDSTESTTIDSLSYFETSDGFGRGYICRVYHEDSLDSYTINDSMFDAPVLSKKEKSTLEREASLQEQEQKQEQEEIEEEEDDNNFVEQDEEELGDTIKEEETEEDKQHLQDLLLMETSRRLSKLEGVCSQIHLGWWSYEWCYDQSVTQFHIHVDGASTGLELRDVTSLGKFSKRKYVTDLSIDNPELSPIVNKYAEDEPELSRVSDTYTKGDTCDATGKPRRTTVQYFCCSDRLMEKYKGPVLRHGNPLTSKIVSIVSLLEDPDELCTYTITVCTPLLCEDVKGDDDDGLLFDIDHDSLLTTSTTSSSIGGSSGSGSGSGGSKSSRKSSSSGSRTLSSSHSKKHSNPYARHNNKSAGMKKENETIRDILDRVIGKACIQSSTSGWWSYEYCHRKHVRQFHESISINIDTGMASSGTEDVYMLGYYNDELDNYPPHEEYKHVVNTTLSRNGGGGGGGGGDVTQDSTSTSSGGESSSNGGGPLTVAAYFMSEYTGGDVCDDADVTDSAVKAGGVSSHVIERASSVRYSCGSSFDIYVKEDHTCHYIVEVTVPALCDHPMFKAPVAKKRVVKCIPVEDVSEWQEEEGGEQQQQQQQQQQS